MSNTKVFITNLAKYNAGELVGEWFTLSDGHDELKKVLKRVLGNDEEYFITDYESDFAIAEYDNLKELVDFAIIYDKLPEYQKTVALYMHEYEGVSKSELIEKIVTDTLLDDHIVYEASNERELGEIIADECMSIPENLEQYIDYEKIGRDQVLNGAVQMGDYYIISC